LTRLATAVGTRAGRSGVGDAGTRARSNDRDGIGAGSDDTDGAGAGGSN